MHGCDRDSKPNAAQLRQLKRDNLAWPIELRPVPREQWPEPPFVEKAERREVWRSRHFLVQLFKDNGALRLSVNRTEWDERARRFRDDIAWDDLQRLKREASFGDWWFVEVYPADQSVVNVANMRHIWLLDQPPTFAWNATLPQSPRAPARCNPPPVVGTDARLPEVDHG